MTVGTLFHRTHIELSQWFQAIIVVENSEGKVSVRQLATEIGVNKNTASYMLLRIRKASDEQLDLLNRIVRIVKDSAS